MKIIDLSLPLYSGMPVFAGDPEVSIEVIQTIEKNGWNMRRIEINGHDGTHVNAPLHMVRDGKSLDDYALEDFCGTARVYETGVPMEAAFGYIFRDQNIDSAIEAEIRKAHPRFVGLSASHEFDVDIERGLLEAGIISFERLVNIEKLPPEFMFYGMPLPIRDGDGSPVRAFAIVD